MKRDLPLLLMRSPHLVKIVGAMSVLHNLEEQKSIHFQSCVVLKKKKSPFVHRMISLKILTGFLSWREFSLLFFNGPVPVYFAFQ